MFDVCVISLRNRSHLIRSHFITSSNYRLAPIHHYQSVQESLSLCLCVSTSITICLRLFVCFCVPVCFCLSVGLSVCRIMFHLLRVCVCICVCANNQVKLAPGPNFQPSLYVLISLTPALPVSLSAYLSAFLSLSVEPASFSLIESLDNW